MLWEGFGSPTITAATVKKISAPMPKHTAVHMTARMRRWRRLRMGTVRRYPGGHLGGIARKDENGRADGRCDGGPSTGNAFRSSRLQAIVTP
ncbi:hypothetical protein JCM18882A_04570 [Brevibacterium metallidurans]|uniref:Uncharacterized protein n=1 Tax=Brevibacterium metallidurans TaxID=1482676 RepID=A0ABN0SJH1_9MICO